MSVHARMWRGDTANRSWDTPFFANVSFANVSWIRTERGALFRGLATRLMCAAHDFAVEGKHNQAPWFPINYRLKKKITAIFKFLNPSFISSAERHLRWTQLRSENLTRSCLAVTVKALKRQPPKGHPNNYRWWDDNCKMKMTSAQAHVRLDTENAKETQVTQVQKHSQSQLFLCLFIDYIV